MALTSSGTILGAALGLVTGPTDPAAATAWIGAMSPLVDFLVANTVAVAGAMAASGTTVSGAGLFTVSGDVPGLGVAMANGSGAGPKGADKWTAIAQTTVDWVANNGRINPAGFVANSGGGAVTGTGAMTFSNSALGVALRDAVEATDAPSLAFWTDIGAAILNHLTTATIVLPGAMASPSGGGAVTGVGLLS